MIRTPSLLLFVILLCQSANAQITADQRRENNEIARDLRTASTLFSQGKFEESGELVRKTQERFEKLAKTKDDAVIRLIMPSFRRLKRAHALLELEGVNLKPLKDPSKPMEPMKNKGTVSFAKQVAPILVTKCGRCHVNNARGMVSMANFATLMKGPPEGVIIFPKNAEGSRLIEVIVEGDMPRGGQKVTEDELKLLKTWITEGAMYDGESRDEPIASLVPNARAAANPRVEVQMAKGNETVSFAFDIAPILLENCAGCHGDGRRASGRFDLTNIRSMFRGGESGAPVMPGNPEESLLIQKLKGTAGARMPLRRDPLSTDVIAKIEKWIKEGARFDGEDQGAHIRRVYGIAKATRATHDELMADRLGLAKQNWRLGMPDTKANEVSTKNFLILGSKQKSTLEGYGKRAEAMASKVGTMLRADAAKPLVKGRVTLFFFDRRYDYGEFGKMVEGRELPRGWREHWKYDVIDAYGAIWPPKENDDGEEEYSLDLVMAEHLAGAHLSGLGKVPEWFATGAAMVVAAKMNPKDARVQKWNEAIPGVLSEMKKPDDMITGKLGTEQTAIASYAYLSYLMKNTQRFHTVIKAMRGKQPFGAAFSKGFGGSPTQVASIWAQNASRQTPGRRRRR